MREFMTGWGYIVIYFVICASVAICLRVTIKIADEAFCKLLQGILIGSLAVWVIVFQEWWHAALSALIFAIIVYPILVLAEKIKGYSQYVSLRNYK